MALRIVALLLAFAALLLELVSGSSFASDEKPEVYFISPNNGDTVKSPVRIVFGLRGMGVAPAGTEVPNTGHHHLIIDAPLPPLDENIPMDENHVHFGGGQTEASIELSPGTHTLQLLLGDLYHMPHEPAVYSKQITITVAQD